MDNMQEVASQSAISEFDNINICQGYKTQDPREGTVVELCICPMAPKTALKCTRTRKVSHLRRSLIAMCLSAFTSDYVGAIRLSGRSSNI